MDLKEAIIDAKKYLGDEIFTNLSIDYHKSDDDTLLLISKNDNSVDITYGSLVNLFRGLTLIKEKADKNKFSFELHSQFETNGLMLDCSRNGVLKNDKVKEMIMISALMGHNRLLLYTEDTFQLDKYPYFGYLRGAYSKEDIKEFVKYGESFGVELVPCIQTLGHLRQALKWAPMDDLRDGPDTLLIDSPKTYEFIEEMIKFSRECFSSDSIHIGMDESFEMGLNRYLKIHGYQNRIQLFSKHLTKVRNLCNKYGFKPMLWSDMYFRLNDEKDNYYSCSPLPEDTIQSIPNGVKLIYWDYYHDKQDNYVKMIKYHKQTNREIVFAGGSWRWKGFAPSIKKSMEYTRSAFEACKSENIKDVFITAWGDDGNECSFFSIIPVLAETSVMNYGDYNLGNIASLVRAISDDNIEDFFAMDLPDLIQDKEMVAYYNPSKYLFYQDVLLGMFDSQVKDSFAKKYSSFSRVLQEKSKESKRFGYVYSNLANLCEVLSIKVDMGIKLRKYYKENNKEMLSGIANEIDILIKKLDSFHESNEEQWMTECRPFGYEVLDGRLGFLKNRILFTKKRINDYIQGKIDRIEELESDILPYDGRDDEVSWNWWLRNVSPSN